MAQCPPGPGTEQDASPKSLHLVFSFRWCNYIHFTDEETKHRGRRAPAPGHTAEIWFRASPRSFQASTLSSVQLRLG